MRHLASLSLLLFALRPALFLAPAPRLARCELSLLRIAASPRATVDDEDILPPTLAADADDGMGRLMRPKDPTFMLTESERLRRQPVHGLKRKRRSRKIRTAEPNADKLLPIVPGARQTVEESIISAYVGDTLGKQQEAGEDYWVDPLLLKEEQEAKRMMEARRKNYKRNTQVYKEEKLKAEIAAPYKNNIIGLTVILVGVLAVLFNYFPGLFEAQEPEFPAIL